MHSIEWTEPAAMDLFKARDYIAQDSAEYAERFAQKIIEAVEKLSSFPQMGRKVRESSDPLIREMIHKSYRIIYRIEESRILILAVVHCGRDFEAMEPRPWEIP